MNGHKFKLTDDMPILDAAPAYLICEVLEINKRGDHGVFISKIKDAIVRDKVNSLRLFETGWKYGG